MIKEDLVAERIAIDSYARDDPLPRATTIRPRARMLEGILAIEEEHADDLVTLLEELRA